MHILKSNSLTGGLSEVIGDTVVDMQLCRQSEGGNYHHACQYQHRQSSA